MEQNKTENKIFDFIKGNSKVFIYSILSLLIIFLASFFYISNTESKKIKISEDYIKAKVLLNNGLDKSEIIHSIFFNPILFATLSSFSQLSIGKC